MIRPIIHIALHFLLPATVALLFFRSRWKRAWLIMLATMVIDIDHLFATPIYNPNRCGIGFHLLHSWPAMAIYALLLCFGPTRLVGLGLALHMLLDMSDCIWMRI